MKAGEFPSSLVIRTLGFHCQSWGSTLCWGTEKPCSAAKNFIKGRGTDKSNLAGTCCPCIWTYPVFLAVSMGESTLLLTKANPSTCSHLMHPQDFTQATGSHSSSLSPSQPHIPIDSSVVPPHPDLISTTLHSGSSWELAVVIAKIPLNVHKSGFQGTFHSRPLPRPSCCPSPQSLLQFCLIWLLICFLLSASMASPYPSSFHPPLVFFSRNLLCSVFSKRFYFLIQSERGFSLKFLFLFLHTRTPGSQPIPCLYVYLKLWFFPLPPPPCFISTWLSHRPKTKPLITNTPSTPTSGQTFSYPFSNFPFYLVSTTIHPAAKAKM